MIIKKLQLIIESVSKPISIIHLTGKSSCFTLLIGCILLSNANTVYAQRIMENLGRGVVAINKGNGNVYISWRLLGTDPDSIGFNIYRSTSGESPVKLNSAIIDSTTDFSDKNVDMTKDNSWFIKPVLNGAEQTACKPFTLVANSPV
jgi:rhamnogalacturonan endolyase